MRRLRKRERADVFVNDRRSQRKGFGRWIYLGLLSVMALSGLNYLWGDIVFFRAEGMVLQSRSDLEAVYVGRLDDIPVEIGQRVVAGQNVATLRSMDIVEKLAGMSLRIAELTESSLENEEQDYMARRMLPLAGERQAMTGSRKSDLLSLGKKGIVTGDKLYEANEVHYQAEENLVRLRAIANRSTTLLNTAQFALGHARASFDNLAEIYRDGNIVAPVSGVVGSTVPSKGEVLLQGDRILSIYHGPKYALVYLPNRHLFPILTGDRVLLDAGRFSSTGRISEILPVSDALPPEFQDTFRPQERGQLAKVEIDGSQDLPLHSKLEVRKADTLLGGLMQRAKMLAASVKARIATALSPAPDLPAAAMRGSILPG